MRFLVFGGTTEGRELVSWLSQQPHARIVACCATEYGGSLVDRAENVTVLTRRVDQEGMQDLIRENHCQVLIDATHPYAALVTANAQAAAEACGVPYVRVLREEEPEGPWTAVPDVTAAADYIAAREGTVLFATGSKDLPQFCQMIPNFAQRAFVRVLPTVASLEQTERLGIPASRVIGMQGPFSFEMNCALIHATGARFLVTKASGANGGFEEKVQAAQACDCELVVIHRPLQEDGFSFAEAQEELSRLMQGQREA